MAEYSAIEWTNATWNPWYGCHKVSQGCKHCYMFREQKMYGRDPNTVVRSKTRFNDPLKWSKIIRPDAQMKVFTCSWSDWFIEEADPWRDEAWEIVRQTPNITYQILTKRPENIPSRLPAGGLPPNVWLGVSVEDQKTADERIPLLLEIHANVRFLSCEPLLGPLQLWSYLDPLYVTHYSKNSSGQTVEWNGTWPAPDWVIAGAESGPGARPAELDWFRSLRDQCVVAEIPFFLKQFAVNGKKTPLPELDGVVWNQFPEVTA
jgi:protein gp37